MTVDELRKALAKIPDEGRHNKAKRANIIRQILELQQKQQGDNKK